jgi:ribosomal protein S18 acetylase RimI-like enzyme
MHWKSLPPPLHWREARPADESFLDRLFLESRDELQDIAGDPAFLLQLLRMQQRAQAAGMRQAYPQAVRLLIERASEPIGQVLVHAGAGELRLLDIAVAPPARRCGVGQAVVATLQQQAALGGMTMGLTVAKTNTAARALYLRLGFTIASQDLVMEHMTWCASGAGGR